jgi:hypothetical protein
MSDLRELGDISLPFALDEKGNYIYIKDADRGTGYYCPCCGKKVNTIAIDEGVEYQKLPHYRHYPHQSCSGESLSHWVYKMWLFNKDSQFYVSNGAAKILYTVETIEIEKTFSTDYGDYRPDITIITTCDKTFYFELNFSNPKRSDDYFCKWSQLNNDVIEVDVKKLLKESLNNKTPTFRLIYSNGICFDDKYNKRDVFANAANKLSIRKLEIQRQDMLNCKVIWEKLDWFFDSIKMFKVMKATMNDVLTSFNNIPFEEMELCFDIVKRITCINDNDGFRDIINENFNKYINDLLLFYNNKYIDIAKFKIFKDTARKTLYNIECITESKIGVIGSSVHLIKDTILWKKYFYPYSLYKEFENTLIQFSEKLTNHMSQVLIINNKILSMTSEDDIEYYKTLQRITSKKHDLINSKTDINDIILKNIKDINRYRYDKNIKKLTETKYKFNDDNEIYDENDYSITCKYKTQVNDYNQITSIKFTFGSSSLENYLHKFIKLSEYCIEGVESANYFLNLKPDERYKKLVNNLDVIDLGNNMINIHAVEIISKFIKILKYHDYLYLKLYCENAHLLKFKINIKVNHGSFYSSDYSEYTGSTIELKNNMIDGIDITNMERFEIEKIICDKLKQSKDIATYKLMRFDGIDKNSRFVLQKEDR